MEDNKDYVKHYIHSKRDTLSQSSLTTYASVLKSLYKNCFGEGKVVFTKFDETKKVLTHLKDIPPNRRKTILSALVIITGEKEYRDQMLDDVRDYNKEIQKQEKTPEQEANWIDGKQIKEVFDAVRADAVALMKKKQHLKPAELQEIQNYIILCVLSGVYIPPRRSKDYCDFKIKNIDENKDNYMKKKELVFNSYKTAKSYGEQRVTIEAPLTTILTNWSKINPTEWLLFDSNMNKLTPVKLNQRLNKIFGGKHIAVNQMRHTYLTEKYPEQIKKDKEQADTMEEMGSSPSQLKTYIKKD